MDKKLSRRTMLKMLGTGGVAGFLAACGSTPTTTTEATTAATSPDAVTTVPVPVPAGATQITYWTFWADVYGTYQEELVKMFNESQTAVYTNVLIVPWGDLSTKLTAAVAGGNPPDASIIDRPEVPQRVFADGILPIDQYIASQKVNGDEWFPVSWEQCKINGKMYAMPYEGGTYKLVYNKALLTEAGLDPAKPPTTWDELDTMAEKLTKEDGQGGYSVLGYIPWFDRRDIVFRTNGGSFYDAATQKFSLDSAENIETMTWMHEKYAKKYGIDKIDRFSASAGASYTADEPIIKGTIAMQNWGSWNLSNVANYKPDGDYGAATPPGKVKTTVNQGSAGVVPKGAKLPEQGFTFINWMCTTGIKTWVNRAADLVSRKDQLDIVPTVFEKTPKLSALYTSFAEELETAQADIVVPIVSYFNKQLSDAIDSVTHDQKTPEQALKDAQTACTSELERALRRAG